MQAATPTPGARRVIHLKKDGHVVDALPDQGKFDEITSDGENAHIVPAHLKIFFDRSRLERLNLFSAVRPDRHADDAASTTLVKCFQIVLPTQNV